MFKNVLVEKCFIYIHVYGILQFLKMKWIWNRTLYDRHLEFNTKFDIAKWILRGISYILLFVFPQNSHFE